MPKSVTKLKQSQVALDLSQHFISSLKTAGPKCLLGVLLLPLHQVWQLCHYLVGSLLGIKAMG